MQDSKQIDELFRLMDNVCENGDAALPALEQYLQTQTDAPEIDTEASLKKFKADHREFFVKPHRGRRLCYRIFVVAAAVLYFSCTAAIILLPMPLPTHFPLTQTSTVNCLSWSGPVSPVST